MVGAPSGSDRPLRPTPQTTDPHPSSNAHQTRGVHAPPPTQQPQTCWQPTLLQRLRRLGGILQLMHAKEDGDMCIHSESSLEKTYTFRPKPRRLAQTRSLPNLQHDQIRALGLPLSKPDTKRKTTVQSPTDRQPPATVTVPNQTTSVSDCNVRSKDLHVNSQPVDPSSFAPLQDEAQVDETDALSTSETHACTPSGSVTSHFRSSLEDTTYNAHSPQTASVSHVPLQSPAHNEGRQELAPAMSPTCQVTPPSGCVIDPSAEHGGANATVEMEILKSDSSQPSVHMTTDNPTPPHNKLALCGCSNIDRHSPSCMKRVFEEDLSANICTESGAPTPPATVTVPNHTTSVSDCNVRSKDLHVNSQPVDPSSFAPLQDEAQVDETDALSTSETHACTPSGSVTSHFRSSLEDTKYNAHSPQTASVSHIPLQSPAHNEGRQELAPAMSPTCQVTPPSGCVIDPSAEHGGANATVEMEILKSDSSQPSVHTTTDNPTPPHNKLALCGCSNIDRHRPSCMKRVFEEDLSANFCTESGAPTPKATNNEVYSQVTVPPKKRSIWRRIRRLFRSCLPNTKVGVMNDDMYTIAPGWLYCKSYSTAIIFDLEKMYDLYMQTYGGSDDKIWL